MTSLALSRITGRPVAATSALAVAAAAKPAPKSGAVPPDLRHILRPQAMTRWILPQLSAITPTYIESTLRGAFTGSHLHQWELFDLMEDTWPRLLKNLGEVKRAVCALDWKVEPWAEQDTPPTDTAQERARLVSNACWRMRPDPCCDENGFLHTLRDMLDALGKGTSVLEILWETRHAGALGTIMAPRATQWAHPSTYAWDTEGKLGLNYAALERMAGAPRGRTYGAGNSANPAHPGDLGPFPEDKFIVAIHKAKTGSPLTSALLRPLAWWWCASNFSADWLMNLAQLFGLPFRWANHSETATQTEIDKICTALQNMGSAAWAVFPEGTTLELKEPAKTSDNSPQADLLDRADKNCDLLILGQTLTSDTGGMGQGGGSLALGKVHATVRDEVIAAAASFVAGVLNEQLNPAILRQNYGNEDECPEWKPCPNERKDEQAAATRDATLIAAGVEVPRKWFYARHGIPLPTPGEDVIGRPAPTPSSPPTPTPDRDPEDEEPKQEDEDESAPTQARSRGPAVVAPVAVHRLAGAFAEDLKPLRDRIERILTIQDPEILRAKLQSFRDSLPALLTDINADPESARVLEDTLQRQLLDGLTAQR